MDTHTLRFAFDIALVLLGAAAAYIWLRSAITRQRTVETEGLVELRGHHIHDLQEQITELQRQINFLEGQIDLIQKMRTLEIVEGVVEGIIPFLPRQQ